MPLPDRSLLLLWRLKLRGRVRVLLRRSRSVGGAISILAGALLVLLWMGSIVLRSTTLERTSSLPSVDVVRLGLFAYVVFVAFASLSLRGVYLPRPELERLFAAPIARGALVRYRMLVTFLQTVPFAALMAIFLAPRLPSFTVTLLAFVVFAPTAAFFGQALSLLSARTGGWVDRALSRVSPSLLRIVGGIGAASVFLLLAFGPGLETPDSRERAERERFVEEILRSREARGRGAAAVVAETEAVLSLGDRLEAVATHPATRVVTAPLTPWARAVASPNLVVAAPWLALSLLLMLLLYEGVARMPVDYREASLRASMDVERRLARVRQGQGGVGAFGTSARARGWAVPWIFGRTRFGAIVWLRTAMLVRQARGTLFVVAAVAILGIVLGTRVLTDPVSGTAVVAVLGIVYLGSGMRVDFRADLDRMDALKAWPVSARTAFVATVVPGALLTSCVVLVVLLVRATILGQFTPDLTWYALGTPAAAYVWIALDNAVFLLFPVRFMPGQGSAIQHMGRGFLLVMFRGMLLFGAMLFAAGGAVIVYRFAEGGDPGRQTLAVAAAFLWTLTVVMVLLALVTSFGGWALRRFDVSRTPTGTA
ncbi:MAG: hypothetical protein AAF957_16215 [Planctomycetota bacterium]